MGPLSGRDAVQHQSFHKFDALYPLFGFRGGKLILGQCAVKTRGNETCAVVLVLQRLLTLELFDVFSCRLVTHHLDAARLRTGTQTAIGYRADIGLSENFHSFNLVTVSNGQLWLAASILERLRTDLVQTCSLFIATTRVGQA